MKERQQLPDDQSWDRFWKRGPAARSTHVSSSKQRIQNILSAYLVPEGRVLDAGCGSGYFSQYFFEHGQRPVALDYSAEALAMTRTRTQQCIQTVQADLIKDDLARRFSDERFDLIFSDGLFEHFVIFDQDKILQNICTVLKDGGVVVTVVPNRWSPWQIIRPFLMKGIEERPFVLTELRDMHERNGLKVVKSGGINVLPIRLSPEFLGRIFGMLLYVIAQKTV